MYRKPIIIISTYPSNNKLLDLLDNCIKNIKLLNYDVLVVSHLTLPKHITQKVKYVLYDSVNDLLNPKNSPHVFFYDVVFQYKYFIGGHALPITRNIKTSLSFAKSLGYDSFLFLDSDIIFTSENLTQIQNLIMEAKTKNKKMVLFNPTDYNVSDCDYNQMGPFFIETDFFIGDIDFTLKTIKPPIDNYEWYNNKMCYNLEVSFYTKLKKFKDELLLIDDYSSSFFNEENLNKNRYGLVVYDVVKNIDNVNEPVLICHNSEYNISTKKIFVYQNSKLILERVLHPSDWSYIFLKYDNSNLRVELYDVDKDENLIHENTKIFTLNNKLKEKNINNYTGIITFKNTIIK